MTIISNLQRQKYLSATTIDAEGKPVNTLFSVTFNTNTTENNLVVGSTISHQLSISQANPNVIVLMTKSDKTTGRTIPFENAFDALAEVLREANENLRLQNLSNWLNDVLQLNPQP